MNGQLTPEKRLDFSTAEYRFFSTGDDAGQQLQGDERYSEPPVLLYVLGALSLISLLVSLSQSVSL